MVGLTIGSKLKPDGKWIMKLKENMSKDTDKQVFENIYIQLLSHILDAKAESS